MKQLFVVFSAICLLDSCAPSLIVTDKRPVHDPFSRILAIYVDDPFEFFEFDFLVF